MAERKRYIEVEVPLINEKLRVLGSLESLERRTIKLDLTRKLKGRMLNITFIIFNVGGVLKAYPKIMELMKAYVRKVVRKNTNYVEDSFVCDCEDYAVIVKPLLVTRKKVSRAVRKNLRNNCRELIKGYLNKRNYLDCCENIFNRKLQKEILPKLKKIYPLSFCDIRVFKIKNPAKFEVKSD